MPSRSSSTLGSILTLNHRDVVPSAGSNTGLIAASIPKACTGAYSASSQPGRSARVPDQRVGVVRRTEVVGRVDPVAGAPVDVLPPEVRLRPGRASGN